MKTRGTTECRILVTTKGNEPCTHTWTLEAGVSAQAPQLVPLSDDSNGIMRMEQRGGHRPHCLEVSAVLPDSLFCPLCKSSFLWGVPALLPEFCHTFTLHLLPHISGFQNLLLLVTHQFLSLAGVPHMTKLIT